MRFAEAEILHEQILNRSVNELKLSARVRRLINYKSIGTVGELIQWSEAGLLKLKATSENPKLCVTLPRRNAHLPMCKFRFRLGRKP
jgi:DNA-directed RNA polymerase alpha subunit